VSLRIAGRFAVVVCTALGLAGGALGCLSDDTSLTVPPRDAGFAFDSSFPTFDAAGSVDGSGLADTGTDTSVPDSAVPPDATPPLDAGTDAAKDAGVDAGKDAMAPSQTSLVAGGAVGHSPSYKMTVTTGQATAPVLKSPKYQLVGGVSVTARKP
jgi:hypothetical protein